jgi:hypothetical protein
MIDGRPAGSGSRPSGSSGAWGPDVSESYQEGSARLRDRSVSALGIPLPLVLYAQARLEFGSPPRVVPIVGRRRDQLPEVR